MTNKGLILIVEDNALIAMDLEDELSDHGYTSQTTASVAGALALIKDQAPDFAILDMHLKSETTFDLARQLKEHDIPFIFLSGNDASSLPEELRSSVVLAKPIRMDQVIDKIRVI